MSHFDSAGLTRNPGYPIDLADGTYRKYESNTCRKSREIDPKKITFPILIIFLLRYLIIA